MRYFPKTLVDASQALRGAADSFGIITTFYFKTRAAPKTIINFSFSFPDFMQSASSAATHFLHIQDFARNSSVVDHKLTFGMYMDAGSFSLSGQYFGSLSDFTNKSQPELLRTLPALRTQSVKELAWLDALTALAGGPLQQPPTGYDLHDTFVCAE